mmetsp:Transcript_43763/g.109219  ORF Transcript_43763/g.109219 Transcript_43763/m.109219 type:complete len:414 (+) Transcript_43763:651-1892(+)
MCCRVSRRRPWTSSRDSPSFLDSSAFRSLSLWYLCSSSRSLSATPHVSPPPGRALPSLTRQSSLSAAARGVLLTAVWPAPPPPPTPLVAPLRECGAAPVCRGGADGHRTRAPDWGEGNDAFGAGADAGGGCGCGWCCVSALVPPMRPFLAVLDRSASSWCVRYATLSCRQRIVSSALAVAAFAAASGSLRAISRDKSLSCVSSRSFSLVTYMSFCLAVSLSCSRSIKARRQRSNSISSSIFFSSASFRRPSRCCLVRACCEVSCVFSCSAYRRPDLSASSSRWALSNSHLSWSRSAAKASHLHRRSVSTWSLCRRASRSNSSLVSLNVLSLSTSSRNNVISALRVSFSILALFASSPATRASLSACAMRSRHSCCLSASASIIRLDSCSSSLSSATSSASLRDRAGPPASNAP